MNNLLDFTILDEIAANNKDIDQNILEVLKDLWICCVSREASLLARKEVLSGKAKFGIVGDGKEVPQVAMARAFKKGDFRSGYYRDQTLMFALGISNVEQYFAQLYADTANDPFSGGRQMNCHYATPLIDENGDWTKHTEMYNITSDISSTGGQMARGLGLALASKKFRANPELCKDNYLSNNGNEVVFCTIGDASTSEGVFWETMNAAAVLQVPLAVSVWDDGYGISVPIEYQTVKMSISEALKGFESDKEEEGINIYKAFGWNYPELCTMYEDGIEKMRKDHKPALFHVIELTQPQGHSTSGSHERYKSKERLEWESEHDCIKVMKNWIVDAELVSLEIVNTIADRAKTYTKECKDRAWKNFTESTILEIGNLTKILNSFNYNTTIQNYIKELSTLYNPVISEVVKIGRRAYYELGGENGSNTNDLKNWLNLQSKSASDKYHNNLYSHSPKSALNVKEVKKVFSDQSVKKNGYEILNAFFDKTLAKYPEFVAFGEDVGFIGGVNQSFNGMQEKYGIERVFDTGIREWTIIGQGIGLAMRGFRPIAEIQYLDYLIYGLPPLTDDAATLRYRSNGLQTSPLIVRTRGHRLEGIWHAGSHLGMILSSLRGMYVLTPRNFVQAAGLYNTMLQSDDPAILVECLNGYRLKEILPDNIGDYTVPLGVPEILNEGIDVTLVTYGSCVRVANEAVQILSGLGISVELIDLQTLMPFDIHQIVQQSLKKTNRLVILDEDVPGGASGFILQQIIDNQDAYKFLDSKPTCITATNHRTPFGSDGDYFCKPSTEDVVEIIYSLMSETDVKKFDTNYHIIRR